MIDLFREIYQTLQTSKLRTCLTGLAVAWGIFMLMVLLGLSQGVVNGFDMQMVGGRSNTLSVYRGYTSKPWHGYKEGRNIRLKATDTKIVEAADANHIESVTAKMDNDTVVFRYQGESITGGYTGVFPSEYSYQRLEMVHGRFINEADMKYSRKVVVLNDEQASILFGSDEKAVGKRINGMGLSWTVVGVYRHDWNTETYVPFATATRLDGDKGDIYTLIIDPANLYTEEQGVQLENTVRETLARVHEFDPTDTSAVWISNNFVNQFAMRRILNILQGVMWAIGLLTLLSGIIGVSNIMFVSVKERTHEIGIRRAIGAPPSSVLRQVVAESIVITTLFGYIGVVLGTAALALIDNIIGDSLEMLNHPQIDISIALEVTVVLIVTGALAGLFPAIKATKVKPVEALRTE